MRISDWSSDVCSSDLMRFVRACPTHFSSSQHRQECAADRGSAEAERCSYGVEALAPAAGWTVTEHRERGASINLDLNIACPGGRGSSNVQRPGDRLRSYDHLAPTVA